MPEAEYAWLPRADILRFEEIERLVDIFLDLGVTKIRLTGGEPLLRKGLPKLVENIAARSRVKDFALTTNGLLLADQAKDLSNAGLHRLTVSLDTLRPDRFRKLTRHNGLDKVFEGIAAAGSYFQNLKIDTVVINGVNDDELIDLIEFGRRVRAEIRFIEYMDVGGATRWSASEVVSSLAILDAITQHYGRPIPAPARGVAPAVRYTLSNGTVFGVIASTTEPFCNTCNRSRLTADGMWFLCLYATAGVDLRKALREEKSAMNIEDLLRTSWNGRIDAGAETRLSELDRASLIPLDTLRRNPHLEMHTRGG
jgi:cyclic pyranopterin phosphate synthase